MSTTTIDNVYWHLAAHKLLEEVPPSLYAKGASADDLTSVDTSLVVYGMLHPNMGEMLSRINFRDNGRHWTTKVASTKAAAQVYIDGMKLDQELDEFRDAIKGEIAKLAAANDLTVEEFAVKVARDIVWGAIPGVSAPRLTKEASAALRTQLDYTTDPEKLAMLKRAAFGGNAEARMQYHQEASNNFTAFRETVKQAKSVQTDNGRKFDISTFGKAVQLYGETVKWAGAEPQKIRSVLMAKYPDIMKEKNLWALNKAGSAALFSNDRYTTALCVLGLGVERAYGEDAHKQATK